MDNNEEDRNLGFGKDSELQRIFDMLNKIREDAARNEDDSEENEGLASFMDDLNLNTEPDHIEHMTKDGLTYVIKQWDLPEGAFKTVDIIGKEGAIDMFNLEEKIMEVLGSNNDMKMVSVDINPNAVKKKSLREQLEEAIAEENYEQAIVVRDKITERNKVMEPIIQELNAAISEDKMDVAEKLMAQLKKIKDDYL